MILATSERDTVVHHTKISQMGETAVANKETGLTLPSNFDLSEYGYANRELVSFENASVNIDNSKDVILGPVTQFNVNGNVTIVQNGTGEEELGEERVDKSSSYDTDVHNKHPRLECFKPILIVLSLHWVIIRNCIIAGTFLFVVVVIIVVVLKNESQNDAYISSYEDPYYNDTLGNHSVFYRKQWGGKPPKTSPTHLKHPVDLIIVSCDRKQFCNSSESCQSAVRMLQKNHQSVKRFLDIGYSFMIGGDGGIYVGTGWDNRNFLRKTSIGINFLGNFVYDELTENMVDAFQELVTQGLQLGKISNDYKLVGENQTDPHAYLSPGPNVVKLMKSWSHFYNNTWF